MALSESTVYEPSAAELINLSNILQICESTCLVPDVGPFTIRPDLSLEHHYTFALDRFEKRARVFDNSYYAEEVLSAGMSEEKLDELVVEEAQQKGVPPAHFPQKRKRKRNRSSLHPPLESAPSQDTIDTPTTAFHAVSKLQRPFHRRQLSPILSPRKSMSTQASIAAIASDDTILDKGSHPSPPFTVFHLPKSHSVMSFMTTSSRSTTSLSPDRPKKRRDSVMHFFRRDPRRNRSEMPVCTTPSIAEVPELSSPQSHESQDLSSLQSLDLSTRTSTSSFGERRPLPTFEPHQITKLCNSEHFQLLLIQCKDQMLNFNDFAQHQKVALPLILGRNRLWLEGRKQTNLAELRKKHKDALDTLENKHAARELAELERMDEVKKDKAARNATAIKHLNKRMDFLKDNVTKEHLNRFEEELDAMDTLEKTQERDLQKFHLNQDRQKMDLLRDQEKEVEEMEKSLDEDNLIRWKVKQVQLVEDVILLDDIIWERQCRLVDRWFLRLQILKMEDPEMAHIKDPVPLSVMGLPSSFTECFGDI